MASTKVPEETERRSGESERAPYASFYFPRSFLPVLEAFKRICGRERESASKKIRDWIANYVRIHEPGNPQWSMDRFFEEKELQVQIPPDSERSLPDYSHMTDEELLRRHNYSLTSYGDKMIIASILKRRGLEAKLKPCR